MADGLDQTESKRGRVKRLLIDPLIQDGMRKRAKTPDDTHRNFINRVADDLTYMSDDGLIVLRKSLRTKGEGSNRHFWPCRVTILGLAESFEQRPLEEMREMLSWFASRAGPAALEAGRHVVEYEFWKKYKRPPTMPGDRDKIRIRVEVDKRRLQLVAEQISRNGKAHTREDEAFADWHEKQSAYVRGLIEGADQ